MDTTALANLSNIALWLAMAILAFAMICFAVDVAGRVSRRPRRRAAARTREAALVGVGVGVGAGTDDAGPSGAAAADLDDEPREDRSDRAAGPAGGIGMSLSWLGAMFIAVSMAMRGLSVHRAPVGNMYEFAVAGSFLVMAIYLGLALRRPLKWLGLFVVLPVLLVLGLASTVWYTTASELVPSLKSTWLVIHVPVAILSSAIFTMGFLVLLLHLAQARREDRIARGLPVREGFLSTLPDAESLDRRAYSLNVVAFPLWTFTLIAGAIWGQYAWGTYWSWDPKEVWTFVIWTIYAGYLHARATSGWSMRTANIIAVVAYLAIIVNFTVVNMYFPGMHSYSGLK